MLKFVAEIFSKHLKLVNLHMKNNKINGKSIFTKKKIITIIFQLM